MKLTKFVRGAKRIDYILVGDENEGEPPKRSEEQHHPPNAALDAALSGLKPVVCKWMDTTLKSWESILAVNAIHVGRTTAGTRSVALGFTLRLPMQGGDSKGFTTPYVRIDKAEDGEDDKPIATPAHVGLIESALRACDDYIGGAWQPGKMGSGGPDAEEGKSPKTGEIFDDDAVVPE